MSNNLSPLSCVWSARYFSNVCLIINHIIHLSYSYLLHLSALKQIPLLQFKSNLIFKENAGTVIFIQPIIAILPPIIVNTNNFSRRHSFVLCKNPRDSDWATDKCIITVCFHISKTSDFFCFQVVWYSSYKVGCGAKLCPGNIYFYGCHYYRAYVPPVSDTHPSHTHKIHNCQLPSHMTLGEQNVNAGFPMKEE